MFSCARLITWNSCSLIRYCKTTKDHLVRLCLIPFRPLSLIIPNRYHQYGAPLEERKIPTAHKLEANAVRSSRTSAHCLSSRPWKRLCAVVRGLISRNSCITHKRVHRNFHLEISLFLLHQCITNSNISLSLPPSLPFFFLFFKFDSWLCEPSTIVSNCLTPFHPGFALTWKRYGIYIPLLSFCSSCFSPMCKAIQLIYIFNTPKVFDSSIE